MRTRRPPCARSSARRALLAIGSAPLLASVAAANPVPSGSISSAWFTIDLAAYTGARTIGGPTGVEVNRARLYDLSGGGLVFDMSTQLFGAPGSPALIDQGTLNTGLYTVNIDSSFFPAILGGKVGFVGTLTDTFDNMFAIDFMSLSVDDGAQIITCEYGTGGNDGYAINLADGSPLPGTLASGALTQNGTGFDERISSKSLNFMFKLPSPGAGTLLTGAAGFLTLRRRR